MDKFVIKATLGKREPSMLSDGITSDMLETPIKKLKLDVVSQEEDICNETYPTPELLQSSPLKNINDESFYTDVTPGTTPVSDFKRKKLSKEEKEIRRQEKEKMKKERELVAEKKKLEKERIAREREEERARKKKEEEEIKKKKEEERQAKEFERTKKRQEEEEARKKREEERLAKKKEREEIEAKKEMERLAKKREEEAKKLAKRQEEEAKQKKEKLQSEILLKFLNKATSQEKEKDDDKNDKDNCYVEIGGFQPFYIKEGTTMAPINRREMLCDEKYDDFLKFTINDDYPDYLSLIKKKSFKTYVEKIPMKAKYYMFADSYRPPYFGTFRKKSKTITGRRPFAMDDNLDYEVLSENEWEEEAEGDECRSDDETDEEEDCDVDDDDEKAFFVEPGYLSEDEGQSEADDIGSDNKISKISNKKRAEFVKKEWEQTIQDKKKKTKSKKLIPVIYGPSYIASDDLDYNNLPPGIIRSIIFDWSSFIQKEDELKNDCNEVN
ncbi:Chromatin assembly factor 1 subunit A [Strongyloides ratti]|uniref:Chromatin assembly factor 1 subunit A n=1 Tax=Strongyloides ratti TaxID=34506 RepID=A0A090LFK1_STRRB|nr:Chromatin assembly factor 1 subunit A [Strongyloides ratti]CEF66250.1 Chromatin assembly factor 1 subunit A [Strongyloides ratti]